MHVVAELGLAAITLNQMACAARASRRALYNYLSSTRPCLSADRKARQYQCSPGLQAVRISSHDLANWNKVYGPYKSVGDRQGLAALGPFPLPTTWDQMAALLFTKLRRAKTHWHQNLSRRRSGDLSPTLTRNVTGGGDLAPEDPEHVGLEIAPTAVCVPDLKKRLEILFAEPGPTVPSKRALAHELEVDPHALQRWAPELINALVQRHRQQVTEAVTKRWDERVELVLRTVDKLARDGMYPSRNAAIAKIGPCAGGWFSRPSICEAWRDAVGKVVDRT